MLDFAQIIKNLKKSITTRDILIAVLIIVFYLFTRLVYLTHFPIFSDEGIYIHWSKIAWHDATWRFISLTDGRQPLQTWATIPFLKLFRNDELFGGRLFGVVSGFISLLGIFFLSAKLFRKKIAYIAATLYIITPFFIFFDRLAMIDSLVNAAAIWILLFSLLLVEQLRFDVMLIFGMLSGLFLLAKSNVSMFLAISIFAPIVGITKNVKKSAHLIINYSLLYAGVLLIAVVIYNIQRLSPFFHFVDGKNYTFILTFKEFLSNPFQVFWYNVVNIPLYTAHNLGWTTFFLGVLGFFLYFKKEKRMSSYLGLWIIMPYLFMSFFMRVLYSRYHIFLLSFVLLFSSYAIYHLYLKFKNKSLFWLLLILAYIFTFYFSYTVLFDYKNIPFLETDRGQYIEGWPSGIGAREIMDYARNTSLSKPVIILAEGNFGMSGDVLDTFLKDGDKISIRGYWPLEEKELRDNAKDIGPNTVLAVFAHRDDYPSEWPLKLIHKYEKPGNKSALYLFEVTK